MIVFAVGMSVSGLGLGFYKGWSLTLALLLIGPLIGIGFTSFMVMMTKGMAETIRSYGKSAGYAE